MQRNMATAIVQRLIVVFLISISAGVASAQTKVACVGDSITALPSSWCGTLSTKLGSGYTVMNFGVSGTNLAKNVAQPYWDSAQYTPSHTFAPNIVVIMLGTNDAFDMSWPSAKSHFVADYEELLDTYTMLASKPKPYMIIPTPIGTSPFGHDGKLLETDVIPLIKQVAMEKMVPTIDGFTLFGGAMFDASLYGGSDQVHPNAQGQQKLGEAVYKVLMETGALGGAGGSGSAGSSASTAAAGSGSAGTAAAAGSSASTAAAGSGGAGASAAAGSSASTAAAAGSSSPTATTTTTATTTPTKPQGSTATVPPRAGVSGAIAGSSASTTSAVSSAGTGAPMGSESEANPDANSGCGCHMAGNTSSKSGLTASLVLLVGIVLRGMRRSERRSRGGAPRR